MKKATIATDKQFRLSDIDKRIYGSFLELREDAYTKASISRRVPSPMNRAFAGMSWPLVRELNVPVIRYPGRKLRLRF